MSVRKLECPCCHGTIEVDASAAGESICCPHCNRHLRTRRTKRAAAASPSPTPETQPQEAPVIVKPEVESSGASPTAHSNRRSRLPLVIGAMTAVVVLGLLGYAVTWWVGRNDDPKRVAEQVNAGVQIQLDAAMQAARKGDLDAAAAHLQQATDQVTAALDSSGGQSANMAQFSKAIADIKAVVGKKSNADLESKLATLNSALLGMGESLQVPAAADDVIWICSIPPGADVWCAYQDEIKEDNRWGRCIQFEPAGGKSSKQDDGAAPTLFKGRHYRGKTPLVLRTSPGDYVVGVQLPIEAEYGNVGLKKLPYLPTEAREFLVSSGGTLSAYMRLFHVDKRPKGSTLINTVFCPSSSDYEKFLGSSFHADRRFPVDEPAITTTLHSVGDSLWPDDKKLSADAIESVLKSLGRFGTAMWPTGAKDTFYVAGLRHSDTIALAKGRLDNSVLTPPTIPSFNMPSIPYVPPINIPKINIPKIPAFNPNIGMPNINSPARPPAGRKQSSNNRKKPATSVTETKPRSRPPTPPTGSTESLEKRAKGKLQAAHNFMASGKRDLAKQWLEAIIRDYPDTEAAKAAQKELDQLQ